MSDHEYSIVGHSRSRIGMIIAFMAGGISGGLTTIVGLLSAFLIDRQIEIPELILWPITGGVIFGLLFALFNKTIWRMARFRGVVGVPDFEGTWSVDGRSYDAEEAPTFVWSGTIEITQCYEKITVHLRTEKSSSISIAAAMINEGRAGYRLIYSYRNQPDPGQKELSSHIGHCDFQFSPDLQTAQGTYFNGGGRYSHGKMKITKVGD